MLHSRKSLSIKPTHFNSTLQCFRRCLASKPNHRDDNTNRRNKFDKNGGEEEDKKSIHLLKSRGQHLLTNNRILDAIVRTSNIDQNDTVLEIGPGTGNLTVKLLEVAKKVVAIEIDKRMVEILCDRVAKLGLQDRLDIVCADALKTDFPDFNLVVANIPYGISSPLLDKLFLEANVNPFRSATLLLQKEFAKRLLAKPGESEFNRLAVNLNLLAEVEFVMDVSKRDFVPCPKVDSSVVKICPKSEIPDVYLDEWWAFTRTCFGKKNKTLGAMFKQKKKLVELMRLSTDEERESGDGGSFKGKIVGILESGGFSDKRPSKLCNNELLKLLSLFNKAGIYFYDQAKRKGIYDVEDVFLDCDDEIL